MTTRRKLSLVLGAAMALAAFSWSADPPSAADNEPMPRMTHAQRQAAAAARKEKIRAAVEAQQAAIKEVERQQQGQPAYQSPAKPQTPPAGSAR